MKIWRNPDSPGKSRDLQEIHRQRVRSKSIQDVQAIRGSRGGENGGSHCPVLSQRESYRLLGRRLIRQRAVKNYFFLAAAITLAPESRQLDQMLLQNNIASAIANKVQAGIAPSEVMKLAPPHRVDPRGYDAYVKGRGYWSRSKMADHKPNDL